MVDGANERLIGIGTPLIHEVVENECPITKMKIQINFQCAPSKSVLTMLVRKLQKFNSMFYIIFSFDFDCIQK